MWLLREIFNFGCVQRDLLTQEGVGESSVAVKHRSCEWVPRSAGHFILIWQANRVLSTYLLKSGYQPFYSRYKRCVLYTGILKT